MVKTKKAIPIEEIKSNTEVPARAIAGYEPCNECKEFINQGVQLIGTTLAPIIDNMPPITMMEGPRRRRDSSISSGTFVVVGVLYSGILRRGISRIY